VSRGAWRPPSPRGARILVLLGAASIAVACGKKGPPLPPLIRIPVPPGDFTAARRGAEVELQFTVPNVNTDGSRPANVMRVDAYAFSGAAATAAAALTDDQLLKLATKVGSVPVKAPRDPNLAVEPDESSDDMEPPEGGGLDQGSTARLAEQLTPSLLKPVDLPQEKRKRARPLLGPAEASSVRTYAIVGVTARGRRGTLSKRVTVPLAPPPSPPSSPRFDYDETTITVMWLPPGAAAGLPVPPGQQSLPAAGGPPAGGGLPSASGDVLPARPIGIVEPKIAYNVYESATPTAGANPVETRLTSSPITETTFVDNRITWGVERCYLVRSVAILGGLSVVSEATPPACRTLVDTFPPTAPKGLNVVPGQGYVSLIWQPNTEKDLAGYLVLRGEAPGDKLVPITPAPISDTTFTDDVPAAVRYVDAVQAVDRAGNVSPPSNPVEASARD